MSTTIEPHIEWAGGGQRYTVLRWGESANWEYLSDARVPGGPWEWQRTPYIYHSYDEAQSALMLWQASR